MSIIASCGPSPAKQDDSAKYFEGFVEFIDTYEGPDVAYIQALRETYGARTIIYLGADGSFAREYIDSNNVIVAKEIYRPDSLKTYHFKSDSDTIICSAVTRNISSSLVSIDKQSSFKILGHKAEVVTAKRLVEAKAQTLKYYVYTTYYNDVNYAINPLTYKHYLRSSVEDIFTKSPYITVGYKTVHGNRCTRTSIAKRVVVIRIESRQLEKPKNKIIIER